MAIDEKRKIAMAAQSAVSQLQARLRDGDEEAVTEAKELLHSLVEMSSAYQLAVLLVSVGCQASIDAAPPETTA